jgi:hypothetical protein
MSTADNAITKSSLAPLVATDPAGTDLLQMLRTSPFFGDFPAPQVKTLTRSHKTSGQLVDYLQD